VGGSGTRTQTLVQQDECWRCAHCAHVKSQPEEDGCEEKGDPEDIGDGSVLGIGIKRGPTVADASN